MTACRQYDGYDAGWRELHCNGAIRQLMSTVTIRRAGLSFVFVSPASPFSDIRTDLYLSGVSSKILPNVFRTDKTCLDGSLLESESMIQTDGMRWRVSSRMSKTIMQTDQTCFMVSSTKQVMSVRTDI